MLLEMTRDFAQKEIAPYADKWDEEHYFPHQEVVKKMGELGIQISTSIDLGLKN